jgi:hypothetical protein
MQRRKQNQKTLVKTKIETIVIYFLCLFTLGALATITALSRTCPPALAGIVC